MLIPFLMLFAAPEFTDSDREDAVASHIQCAAFHTIEADIGTATEKSPDAHRAVARDFLDVALHLAGSAKADAVQADLTAVEADYREELKKGDARAMAEGWTELESACTELHKVKDALLSRTGGDENSR